MENILKLTIYFFKSFPYVQCLNKGFAFILSNEKHLTYTATN